MRWLRRKLKWISVKMCQDIFLSRMNPFRVLLFAVIRKRNYSFSLALYAAAVLYVGLWGYYCYFLADVKCWDFAEMRILLPNPSAKNTLIKSTKSTGMGLDSGLVPEKMTSSDGKQVNRLAFISKKRRI
jgi:hypothetical protein